MEPISFGIDIFGCIHNILYNMVVRSKRYPQLALDIWFLESANASLMRINADMEVDLDNMLKSFVDFRVVPLHIDIYTYIYIYIPVCDH